MLWAAFHEVSHAIVPSLLRTRKRTEHVGHVSLIADCKLLIPRRNAAVLQDVRFTDQMQHVQPDGGS